MTTKHPQEAREGGTISTVSFWKVASAYRHAQGDDLLKAERALIDFIDGWTQAGAAVPSAPAAFAKRYVELSDENRALKARIAELEAAPTDTGVAGAGEVKTWQERCGDTGPTPSLDEAARAMKAEIADLRAQLRQHQDSKPTDLSKRLRKMSENLMLVHPDDLIEAADEIERLAAAQGEPVAKLVMADGKTSLYDYLAGAVPDDQCGDDWTKGYEEQKRRLLKVLGPQLLASQAVPLVTPDADGSPCSECGTEGVHLCEKSASQAVPGDEVRDAKSEPLQCWSRDEEDFNALALGDLLDLHDDLMPGMTVWVGEAVHPAPKRLIRADWVIEQMGEQAYDIAGDHADDYPDVSAQGKAELETFLHEWVTRTCPPNFYEVKNVKPYVLTTSDFTDERATKTEGEEQQ